MAANNLRVLLDNKITAVGGSSLAKSMNDYTSQYDAAATTFTITTSPISGPVAVVAILAGYTGPITMTVTGQGSVTETIYQSSTAPRYIARYFTAPDNTTMLTITFSVSVNVSKFIVDNYWSPKYNVPYGTQVYYDDLTKFERTISGDLRTTLAPKAKHIQLNLDNIHPVDKLYIYKIMKTIGLPKPIFLSVYPEYSDKALEQMYSIYGRTNTAPSISYAKYQTYSSSLHIEEN